MGLSIADQNYLKRKKIEIVDNCPKCSVMRSPGCECAERLRWEVEKVAAGIPLLLRELTLDNFTHPEMTKQKEVLGQLIQVIKTENDPVNAMSSWIFSGPSGTGKTLGACLLLQEFIKRRIRVKYLSSIKELSDIIASSWENKASPEMEAVKQAQVLVIDGVGTSMSSLASGIFSSTIAFLNEKILNGTKIILVSALSKHEMMFPQDLQLLGLTIFRELNFAGFSYSMILEQAAQQKVNNGN